MASATGREVTIAGVRIAGLVSCVPGNAIDNGGFGERFGEAAVSDVVKMIGVHTRRQVSGEESTGDLCREAGRVLLDGLGWSPDSVDGLIFVSQTPDYRLPATACALQRDLDIPAGIFAFDVNLGCSGYPYALWLAATIIQSGAARRVLVAVGDTISRVVDPADRATAMLFGDAGTMTALEQDPEAGPATFILGSDGAGVANLIIPDGGFKSYATDGDKRMDGKNPACLFMDGGEIFNFTLRSVPPMVNRMVELTEGDRPHDFYLMHQANRFMVNHLRKKSKLAEEQVPINIQDFGNTSSASIPLLMTTTIAEVLRNEPTRLAIFGFGVGYSWAAASLTVGPLAVAEVIER